MKSGVRNLSMFSRCTLLNISSINFSAIILFSTIDIKLHNSPHLIKCYYQEWIFIICLLLILITCTLRISCASTVSLRELVITIFSAMEYTLPVYYSYLSNIGWRDLEETKNCKNRRCRTEIKENVP